MVMGSTSLGGAYVHGIMYGQSRESSGGKK